MVTVFSCISPLYVETGIDDRVLVVEGYISTVPGPYVIRVTNTAKYGSVFSGFENLETGAEVWITDEQGNPTFLTDMDNGLYQTPFGFRGEIGKTYILHIVTANGERYSSTPEPIVEVPAIDSIYYQFSKKPTSDPTQFILGVEIFLNWLDPEDESNYYYWRNRAVYIVETFPENYIHPPEPPFLPSYPAPKDCCKECWVAEQLNEFRIKSDFQTNGMLNTQQVAFVGDNGYRFMKRCRITVSQHSISKAAYEFLRILQNQICINGDIFDPPPATIRGNIINLDDPDANVIGYFYATDTKTVNLYVDAADLPETQPGVIFNDDCRVLRGATIIKPLGWY